MAYSEKDGQVVLTMSREDYEALLLNLSVAMSAIDWRRAQGDAPEEPIVKNLAFLNRLNQGNPNYRPYQVGDAHRK